MRINRRYSRNLLSAAVVSALALPLAGCPQKGIADPDAQSGADGNRSGARAILPNTTITDDVSYRGLDRSDWYSIRLEGKPGIFTVDIKWDSAGSDLIVDVFDENGTNLTATPTRRKQETDKRLLTQIEKPGLYYVRVQAAGEKDATAYLLKPQWEEPKHAVAPPPPPPPKKEEPKPVKHVEETPTPPPPPPPQAELDGVQARIVSSYKEEGSPQVMLQIDKGSSAGVKVGTTGVVLEGSSGEHPMSGSDFTVVKIIDAGKCVAKTKLKSVGRNNRVLLQIGQ